MQHELKASQITDTLMSTQQRVWVNNKSSIHGPHYWTFVNEIHRWPLDSPQKIKYCDKCLHVMMSTWITLISLCFGSYDDVIKWKHFPRYEPPQRPVKQSFDVFFDPRLNKRLNKQSWGWWFETPSRPLWRHCNVVNEITADQWIHFKSSCNAISVYMSWRQHG